MIANEDPFATILDKTTIQQRELNMNKINLNAHTRQTWASLISTITAFSLLAFGTMGFAVGQEETARSQNDDEAIKRVESSGGRVYRISAADTTREISFYLSSKPVGDEQLAGINAISEVIWVNLAGTDITNDGLKHLTGLPIQKLHLERTRIGDEGLAHLKSFKDLTYLNLYDTKVTDAGLEHLKELKQLRKLFVWKSGVTEAGIKKLNESLPDLQIVGELKLEPVVIEEPKKEDPDKANEKAEEKPGESDKAKGDKKEGDKGAGDEQAKEAKDKDKKK